MMNPEWIMNPPEMPELSDLLQNPALRIEQMRFLARNLPTFKQVETAGAQLHTPTCGIANTLAIVLSYQLIKAQSDLLRREFVNPAPILLQIPKEAVELLAQTSRPLDDGGMHENLIQTTQQDLGMTHGPSCQCDDCKLRR